MGANWLLGCVAIVGACGAPGFGGDDVSPPSGTPVLSFDEMTSSYDETDGELEVHIHLSEPTNEVVSFWVDLGGSAGEGLDYNAFGAGHVLMAPGVDFATVMIRLIDDGAPEPAETINLSLSSPTNCTLGLARHTLTIRDNLLPRVAFDGPLSGADESMPGSARILVMPASAVPITVEYTLSGTATASDYTLQNGTVTIPAGETSWPLTFDQIDDSLDEDNETIVVTLKNPTNAILGITPTDTHTIYDDDDEAIAAFVGSDVTVLEGDSGMQLLSAEVRLDRVSGRTVSVSFGEGDPQFFSATLGVDYQIMTPSPLVFPPGTTSQTISYAILGDTVQDGSDRAAITLKSAVAADIGLANRRFIQIDNDDCYAAGVWRVCPDVAPSTDLTLDNPTSMSTSFDGAPCANRQPPGWIASGQAPACFIVARNITVGSARFDGFRPVVLVALDSITVNTLLDAGSHLVSDSIGIDGAGHNPSVCPAQPSLNLGAGGAGGSFMTAGGNGGDHGPADPGGVAAPAVSAPTVLRGGCNGHQPASNDTGMGGGAVYLLAGNTITIAPNAVVNASGSGGGPGVFYTGGNGGGSGGMIVLWAQSIVGSQAHLLANGGGGGEGGTAGSTPSGQGGDVNFANPFDAAIGGSGTAGGDGGAGAVQSVSAVPGSNATSQRGAGGGGGGLGYIAAHPSLSGAVASPTPATF